MSARRLLPLLLALVLGGAAATGLVACGKSDHLIPGADASALDRQLSAVKDSVDSGECDTVPNDLEKLDSQVANLPKSVDAALRNRLRSGVANLSRRAPSACLNVDTVVESTPSVTTLEPDPETTPSDTGTTPPPEPNPTPEPTTPKPTPTPTTPQPTPTPTPTPTTPDPDPGTGGAVAP